MGKCAFKRAMAGCAFEAVVESATKAIGISELKKEQGLAACSFVRGNGIFRFATDGLHGKSICFALLAIVYILTVFGEILVWDPDPSLCKRMRERGRKGLVKWPTPTRAGPGMYNSYLALVEIIGHEYYYIAYTCIYNVQCTCLRSLNGYPAGNARDRL